MARALLSICLVLILTMPSYGDIVTLRNGIRHTGTFVRGSAADIVFVDATGTRRRFDTRDVQSLDFEGTATTRGTGLGSGAASAQVIESKMIPSGTDFVIRTNENIDSRSAVEGRTYAAQMEREVRDSTGALLIPRGSPTQLVIRRISEGGTLSAEELVLDVESVTVQGRRYLVSTAELERSSRRGIGRNRRTAEMVGGGALVGTLLGAIAGGGKGALIGAIAGAATGGAVQVLTKGKEVKVPAETVLTFRLDQPLRLELADRS